jgi:hypothetical protein
LFGTLQKQFRLISLQKILLKNYTIKGYQIAQKISYLFSKNTSWDVFYELQNKENQIGNFEFSTKSIRTFSYAGEKQITLNGEVSFIRINLME